MKTPHLPLLKNIIFRLLVNNQIIYYLILIFIVAFATFFNGENRIIQQKQATILLEESVEDYINSAQMIIKGLSNFSNDENDLRVIQKTHSDFDVLYSIDQSGRLRYIYPPDNRFPFGMDMSGQPYFNTREDIILISAPFISSRTGNPTVFLSARNKEDGGLIVGELNLERLQQSIIRINFSKADILYLIDRNGIFLAHPAEQSVRQMENMRNTTVFEKIKSGQRQLIYLSKETLVVGTVEEIPQTGWYAITESPVIEVYGALVLPALIGLILVTILFIVNVSREKKYITKMVISPLNTLTSEAQRLAAGDYSSEPSFLSSTTDYAEIAELKQSFWRMEAAIRSRQDALNASEERYRYAMDATQDGIWDWDIISGKISFTPSYYRMLGYQQEEFPTDYSDWKLLIHPDDYDLIINKNADCIENRTQNVESEFRMKTKNGDWKSVLSRGKVVSRDKKGYALRIIGTHIDQTDRKLMEAKIISSEKMAGLGTLAAGIAHELNTPLQIITGYSESLLQDIHNKKEDPKRLEHKIEAIKRNGWRCAGIVRSLLSYSHPSTLDYAPQNLNELVRDALLLIEHQLKSWSNINLITRFKEGLPLLMCNRNQISQVLINLLNNARDAMPGGGEIIIESGYQTETQRLFLCVSDNGPGISENIRDKIFDPFFTTKGVGEGSGLGLFIVSSILRSCGGEITYQKVNPSGASFTVYFPEKGPEKQAPPEPDESQGRYLQ